MAWWTKAIIATVVAVILNIAIGMIHTDVVLKGKITKEQDEAISEWYGRSMVYVVIGIWIIAFALHQRRRGDR